MVETPKNYTTFDAKYFVETDPVADMLDGERRDLLDRIDKLESHITQRKKLMYENLNRMDEDSCSVGSRISQAQIVNPYDRIGANRLEDNVLDLERQKRTEKDNAWKDMWFINKELLELMKQYQDFRRKERVVK